MTEKKIFHKVEEIVQMSVSSSELGPPTPSPASKCVSPLDPKKGEQHLIAGEGLGGLNSNEWTEIGGTLYTLWMRSSVILIF
jgi:hypothetical protein